MKIAVLVYGRLNKNIDQYNYIINSIGVENNIDFFCSSDNSSKKDLDNFVNKYKPKKYINSKIIIQEDILNYYKSFPKPNETNVENVIRHFTNKERVYKLFKEYIEKNKTHYDIILCLRIDLDIFDKFNFENTERNILYIPKGRDFRSGINDQIAYGNQYVMEKYLNILTYCGPILENYMSFFHPENLTKANINFHKLKVHRFKFRYNINKN